MKTIKPRHINHGARADDCLDKLFRDVQISEGGFMVNIHEALLPKKGKAGPADGSQVV
jgi:hypothetical protein